MEKKLERWTFVCINFTFAASHCGWLERMCAPFAKKWIMWLNKMAKM